MSDRHAHLTRAVLLGADVAAATAACALAYGIRIPLAVVPVTGNLDVLPVRYLEALPIAVTVMVAGLALAGLHDRRALGRPLGFTDALRGSGLALVLLWAAALLYWRTFQYSRLTIALAAVLLAPLLLVARAAAGVLLRRIGRTPGWRTPAILIGGGRPAAALRHALRDAPWMAVDFVAVLAFGAVPEPWVRTPRIATPADACRLVADGGAREVIVALPADEAHRLPALLEELGKTAADVRVVPDLGDAVLLNPSTAFVGGLPVVSVRERPLYGLRSAAKRAIDAGLSGLLLVLLAPFLLVVGLAVRLSSRGPALHRQERMGLDGRPFQMLKFRTMLVGAEATTGPVFARRGDPRVTPLGRVLRRLSVDELPQLVNVLRGEMSLVGPRPERPPFIAQFRTRLPGYMLRHSVKAGITGWAQVHGLRGESSLEERLRYDLEYIDRWSLLLDIEILGRTAVQVLAGRNAY